MKSPVQMANVWVNITNTGSDIPEISFSQALSYATALGLALRDFDKN
jgi:hypothetical protein